MKENHSGAVGASSRQRVTFIVHAAVIAALYIVLVLVFQYFAFGVIQFRIAEALTILPYFTPAAIPGLFVGCLVSNILSGNIFDIIFGSAATLVAAVLSYLLRRHKYLVPIPPVVVNMLVVPFILKFTYDAQEALPFIMLTVGAGQVIACYVIGIPLLLALEKVGGRLFTRKRAQGTDPTNSSYS